jgi:hypothetical protein
MLVNELIASVKQFVNIHFLNFRFLGFSLTFDFDVTILT